MGRRQAFGYVETTARHSDLLPVFRTRPTQSNNSDHTDALQALKWHALLTFITQSGWHLYYADIRYLLIPNGEQYNRSFNIVIVPHNGNRHTCQKHSTQAESFSFDIRTKNMKRKPIIPLRYFWAHNSDKAHQSPTRHASVGTGIETEFLQMRAE